MLGGGEVIVHRDLNYVILHVIMASLLMSHLTMQFLYSIHPRDNLELHPRPYIT